MALAVLATAAVTALIPAAASYAADGPPAAPSPATPAGPVVTGPGPVADAGCRGVTPATLPVQGAISNMGGTEGGHLWWSNTPQDLLCIGTVVEEVRYPAAETMIWRVVAYDSQYPAGVTVLRQALSAPGAGDYYHDFGVHQVLPGFRELCIMASGPSGQVLGTSCVI